LKIYEVILIATLTLAAWYYYKGSEPFPFFLAFMVIVVMVEEVIKELYNVAYGTNLPAMNLYSKFCIYYYLFVFYELYKDRSWTKYLRFLIFGYVVLTLIWNFKFQDQIKVDYLSYNIGFIFLMILMLKYLYEVIYKRPYYNILTDPYFYFVFGLLLFYTSAFPLLGFINILITNNPKYDIYVDLLNIGNIFLSLAYLGALLCSKRQILSTT